MLADTTLGSVADSRTYNSFGEPVGYEATVSGSSFYSATYTRDKLGRITDKSETVSGATDAYHYSYDDAGRLTEADKNGTLVSQYEYDGNSTGNSNRTVFRQPVSGIEISATYDDQDRLLTYGPNIYSYTDNGELLSRTGPTGTTTFSYDVLGNLRAVVLPDTTNIEYLIDGQNRRVGKKVNGALTQAFVYDGHLQIVAELDGNGNIVSRFVYGDRGNVPSYMIKGGVTYRIIADHLGSPRLILNASDGSVAQRIDYDEFGNVLADTNPGFQPFGFAGGLYDLHTRLVRFGARDYDAEIGRWTAKDPMLFGGGDANLYGYVANDPVNGIDPLGLFDSVCFARCVEENRWDWGWVTGFTLGNPLANALAGETGSGGISGVPSHPTSWQHKVGAWASRVTKNPWFSRAGRFVGRAALVPTIWEGVYDIGAMGRCAVVCSCWNSK